MWAAATTRPASTPPSTRGGRSTPSSNRTSPAKTGAGATSSRASWARFRPPAGHEPGTDRLHGAGGDQLLPFPQRHDAGAAPGHVPDAEAGLRARLRPGGPHHLHLPAYRVAAAAGDRALHRPSAAAVLAHGGNDVHLVRARPPLRRTQLPDGAA